jgi:hypothetical protein
MGIALYALRSRARLLYGSIEVALSILMMWFSLVDLIAKSDSHGFVDMGLQFSATYFGMLQVAAAIYVFVRGMDNCGEGLKRYPNLYERWVLIFPTRKELPITIFQKIEELGRKKPE